jgi:UDPglucose 6-dehydrogenase
MREAASIDIAGYLMEAGASVRAYDPVARHGASGILPSVQMFDDPYEMARDCDAVMVVTEWNEFKQLDLEKLKSHMKTPVVFDGRNIYDPAMMKRMGFEYRGMGR